MAYEKPEHQMRVVIDAEGQRVIDKLFDKYVLQGDEDLRRKHEFHIALDRLLSEFGGRPAAPEDEDEDAEPYDDDTDPDMDLGEDYDEDEETAAIKAAIKSVILKR
jgi:hypothetical protein